MARPSGRTARNERTSRTCSWMLETMGIATPPPAPPPPPGADALSAPPRSAPPQRRPHVGAAFSISRVAGLIAASIVVALLAWNLIGSREVGVLVVTRDISANEILTEQDVRPAAKRSTGVDRFADHAVGRLTRRPIS